VCWPLLCLCRPFMIFKECLNVGVKAKGIGTMILSWKGAYEIGVIGVHVLALPQYLNEVPLNYVVLVSIITLS
jgi:hypothetical protein